MTLRAGTEENNKLGAGFSWTALLSPSVADWHTALAVREGADWREVTYGELKRAVIALSSHLLEGGLQRGDRVAVLAEASPEWAITFLAALRCGAVVVPLDTQLTAAELLPMVTEARPRVFFVSAETAATAHALAVRLPGLPEVIRLDDSHGSSPVGAGLKPAPARCCPRAARAEQELYPHETALLVYTSGTTGQPKATMISLGNLLFQLEHIQRLFRTGEGDVCLSILPLNHLLELVGGLLAVLRSGGQVCYPRSLYPADLIQSMGERKVTRMVTVPLFLKLLQNSIQRGVQRGRPWQRAGFRLSFWLARWAPWTTGRRWLFHGLHRQMGGSLREFFCGGAPLDPAVEQFYQRLGFVVWHGYGLTETSPVIAVNCPGACRSGSVGQPLPGVEVRIAPADSAATEGEILTRGPHVMRGYYQREDLTRQVIDSEGWLHTGDLGYLDRDGFLHVTGRIKDLIVLGGGKKVNPAEVEEVLARSPRAQEVAVLGRRVGTGLLAGTEEVWAVLVPTESLVRQCGGCIGSLETELQAEVRRLVEDLAHYKRPARVVVRLEPLPQTSTRKVRYHLLHQWLDQREESRG